MCNEMGGTGYRKEHLKEIMARGKIPLVAIENLATVQQLRSTGSDYLVVFLQPLSPAAFEVRLRTWLSETSHALSQYACDARLQAREVFASGIYDRLLLNRKVNEAVEEALSFVKELRPDLFKDISTGTNVQRATCRGDGYCMTNTSGGLISKSPRYFVYSVSISCVRCPV